MKLLAVVTPPLYIYQKSRQGRKRKSDQEIRTLGQTRPSEEGPLDKFQILSPSYSQKVVPRSSYGLQREMDLEKLTEESAKHPPLPAPNLGYPSILHPSVRGIGRPLPPFLKETSKRSSKRYPPRCSHAAP